MRLSEKLFNYYGAFGEEEIAFVDSMESKFNDDQKEKLFKEITTGRNKKLGAPDVRFLEHIFKTQKPKNAKRYFWSVCTKCKTEYWYSMVYCPNCWSNGIVNEEHTVKTSEERPKNVIRFNKSYIHPLKLKATAPDEKVCYNCECRGYFCRNFGNPDFECSRNDYDYCPCKACCVAMKDGEREWRKQKEAVNFEVGRKVE